MKKLHVLLAAFLITAMLPACAPATVDCASKEVLCVGLVTDLGKVDDYAFNQAAWEGLQLAHKELGAEVEYIQTVDARDYAKNIAAFGDSHYDVVVTVGFGSADATRMAAAMYPDTDFIGVDQFQTDVVEGMAGLVFHEDQAGFLAGALATMMSKSHQIGAVCPTEDFPSVWRYGEGYKAGATYVDKQQETTTEVFVVYHDDDSKAFTDSEWGQATANAMIEQGVDVIFSCGSLTGDSGLLAAAKANLYAIGVDTDQYLTLPEAAPRMLSSAMKLVTPGVLELIKQAQQGTFPNGNYYGQVGYAPFHNLENEVPADLKTELDKIDTGLRDGSIKTNVPSKKP